MIGVARISLVQKRTRSETHNTLDKIKRGKGACDYQR